MTRPPDPLARSDIGLLPKPIAERLRAATTPDPVARHVALLALAEEIVHYLVWVVWTEYRRLGPEDPAVEESLRVSPHAGFGTAVRVLRALGDHTVLLGDLLQPRDGASSPAGGAHFVSAWKTINAGSALGATLSAYFSRHAVAPSAADGVSAALDAMVQCRNHTFHHRYAIDDELCGLLNPPFEVALAEMLDHPRVLALLHGEVRWAGSEERRTGDGESPGSRFVRGRHEITLFPRVDGTSERIIVLSPEPVAGGEYLVNVASKTIHASFLYQRQAMPRPQRDAPRPAHEAYRECLREALLENLEISEENAKILGWIAAAGRLSEAERAVLRVEVGLEPKVRDALAPQVELVAWIEGLARSLPPALAVETAARVVVGAGLFGREEVRAEFRCTDEVMLVVRGWRGKPPRLDDWGEVDCAREEVAAVGVGISLAGGRSLPETFFDGVERLGDWGAIEGRAPETGRRRRSDPAHPMATWDPLASSLPWLAGASLEGLSPREASSPRAKRRAWHSFGGRPDLQADVFEFAVLLSLRVAEYVTGAVSRLTDARRVVVVESELAEDLSGLEKARWPRHKGELIPVEGVRDELLDIAEWAVDRDWGEIVWAIGSKGPQRAFLNRARQPAGARYADGRLGISLFRPRLPGLFVGVDLAVRCDGDAMFIVGLEEPTPEFLRAVTGEPEFLELVKGLEEYRGFGDRWEWPAADFLTVGKPLRALWDPWMDSDARRHAWVEAAVFGLHLLTSGGELKALRERCQHEPWWHE